jgi:hypothetical protein
LYQVSIETLNSLQTSDILLPSSFIQELKKWLEYKYRTRRVCYKDEHTGGTENQREMIIVIFGSISNRFVSSIVISLSSATAFICASGLSSLFAFFASLLREANFEIEFFSTELHGYALLLTNL